MRIWKITALILVIVAAGAAYAARSAHGVAFRDRFYVNRHCCDLSFARALQATIEETRGGVFPSQIGQDKWVLFGVFPGVRDGYFVDVGSADGTLESNSKALEERGWKGICVDPFPTNMQGRTCAMMKEVVSSVSGRTVKFHTQRLLGGIEETLGKYKTLASEAPAVELTTVTLTEILDRNHAPSFIHFMSLDIEGAELEALKGIAFDRYQFGAMAIEHNDEEPKRTDILKLLEGRGYRRSHTYQQDDLYVRR
jgi:FkbM family methyltransferase